MNSFIPFIGLEIHIELKTKSKMFCQCSANYFKKDPNSHVCPVCLGLPGALPVPNKQAVEWTMLVGKALNCTINPTSKFDRKHYFYPDLPKGYQISQYDEPFAINGKVRMQNTEYGIQRVHLEEDTGKLTHSGENTLIDFNRSGVPLMEIVTEPDFHNSEEVKKFLEELQVIIRYVRVSDADMEKGSMRLEPNISLSLTGELPEYKVEVKNINSFKFVKQAIDYEIKRQAEILDKGEIPPQETRGYSELEHATYSQRFKEQAHDYRYFPEPDIPPMKFSPQEIGKIVEHIPELPMVKILRYTDKLKLKYQDAYIITRSRMLSEYFDSIVTHLPEEAQKVANLMIHKRIHSDLSPEEFIKKAREIFTPISTDMNILSEKINQVIHANSKAVADYNSGKQNAIMYLVGLVMREMKGKADAKTVRQELEKAIKK